MTKLVNTECATKRERRFNVLDRVWAKITLNRLGRLIVTPLKP
jgi:hypothetical protein